MSRMPVGAKVTRGATDDAAGRGRRVVAAWATASTHRAALYETVAHAATTLRPRPAASSVAPRVRWAPTGLRLIADPSRAVGRSAGRSLR